MNAWVAVKRVVDDNVKIRVKSAPSGVDLNNVKMSVNPFDEIALEEAVLRKETGVIAGIIAVSCGVSACQQTMGTALGAALGAAGSASAQALAWAQLEQKSRWVSRTMTQSERPELTAAKVGVSGGRANLFTAVPDLVAAL